MSIEKLREITKKLPSVPSLVDIAWNEDRGVRYKVEKGEPVQGFCLHNDGRGAIQLAFCKKDTTIARHAHSSREWLIVIEGKLKYFNGEYQGKVLNRTDYIMIESGQSHRVKALEDTWLYGITVPSDKGYPNEPT